QVTDPGMFDFSNSRVFTLSAWFRGSASQVEGAAVICKGGGGGGEQYCFDVYQGKFRFYCWDTNHNAAVLNTPAELNGTWQHVVVVFSSPLSHLKFYLNGVAVASGTPPASIIANAHDVTVGSRELSASSGYTLGLDGEIDEVRIYARALSPADVQAIYNEAPLGVAFIQQPSGAALFAGDTLRLAPAVEGTRPIAYQWLKSGTNLAGATLRELAITNVVPADSGDYQLVASNAVNTITSAVARVTVMAVTSVTNGLAGYWRFDEPAGSTAADWSGNNNPGTINNSLGDSGQWTSGKVGGALSFRGPGLGDDYVVIPTWPKAINGTMTLSAWVWADARPDRARIACGGSGVDSIGQFLLTQSTAAATCGVTRRLRRGSR
ncbi:MAG: hypothetical protein NT154_15825, partial [Verrucomicrobia bacterium]|nr:hypothetical protein [Verrucomicrobiota bacterium]